MKIKEIKTRNRRDFQAVYECEHCGHTVEGYGYDDDNFHNNVIPDMECEICEQKSGSEYIPLTPKYHKNQII